MLPGALHSIGIVLLAQEVQAGGSQPAPHYINNHLSHLTHLMHLTKVNTMNLLAQLGLDSVSADPNDIPDNKYDGHVLKDEMVIAKNSNTVSHVITYKVSDGDFKGAERAEWFRFGTDPVDVNGQPTEDPAAIANYTKTASEQNLQWYKKRLIDLGVSEDDINSGAFTVGSLSGIPVTFGVKRNGNYVNVNFVERRDGTAAPATSAQPTQAMPTSTPAAAQTVTTAVPGLPNTQVAQDLSNLV